MMFINIICKQGANESWESKTQTQDNTPIGLHDMIAFLSTKPSTEPWAAAVDNCEISHKSISS